MEDISPLFAVEAEELLEAGKFEDAVELCKKGITAFPDYPSAYTILAAAANRLKNYDLSLDYLNKALDEFPGNKIIKEIYAKTEKLAKKAETEDEPHTDEEITAGKDKEPEVRNDTEDTEEPPLEEGKETPKEETIDNKSKQIDTQEKSKEEESEDTIEHENESKDKIQEDAAPKKAEEDNEIITEETGKIEEEKDKQSEEGNNTDDIEEEIQKESREQTEETPKEEIDRAESESVKKDSDTDAMNSEINEINYNYTEPQNLKAAEIDLIPGFKISPVEASNFDAGMKIKNYNRFLRFKMEENTQDIPEDNIYSKIAENIKKSKIEPTKTVTKKQIENKNDPAAIVSDTMAEIYFRQGAYNQALEIYKKLIKKNPDKKESYEKKISQINQKLEET